MAEPDEPEDTVEIEVDLAEGQTLNPLADALRDVPTIGDMKLDLTKDEKLRTTALMLAIRYHQDTVVNDGALYQQMKLDQKTLTPTTAQKVIEYAWEFEQYLRGDSDVVARLEKAVIDRVAERIAEEMAEEGARTTPGSEASD